MNLNQKYFKLYASCIPVSGIIRSTICDLQKQKIYLISNNLLDLLHKLKNSPVHIVIEKFGYDPAFIHRELNSLVKMELGYWHDDPRKFPDLNMYWESPETISNAIIEVGENSNVVLEKVIPQLHELGCKQIEFRMLENVSGVAIRTLIASLNESKVRGVIITQKYKGRNQVREYISILGQFPRILQVALHSYHQDDLEELANLDANGRILITPENLHNKHCGFVSPNKFVSNMDSFTEAQKYNSCLNKKVSIDQNGNILNCPAMNIIHGNVHSDPIIKAISSKKFQHLWIVSKDQIATCQQCEFRYVCTDCRAFTEDPNNLYSKPLKCGYDPQSGIWKKWSENPLKKEAIAIYGLEPD